MLRLYGRRFLCARVELGAAAILAAITLSMAPVAAQKSDYVGPGKCTDCHDHEDEKEWSEKKDGDGKGKQHLNALNQLEDPSSQKYAEAVGLDDVYDLKGSCVTCHATVFQGDAQYGVSCESCHGPGSGYLKIHQEEGAYQKAVAAGMLDVVTHPERWTKDCLTCHVVNDAALVKAGHPSGDDFDLTAKFEPVAAHWQSKYTAAQIAPAAKTALAAVRKTPAGGAPSSATADSSAAKTAAPAPEKPAEEPPAESEAPAVETKAPEPPPKAAPEPKATPPAPPAKASTKAPAAEPVATAPGLPPVKPTPAAEPVVAGAANEVVPAPGGVDMNDLPRTPAGIVASVQGRLATLLESLLTRGARTPARVTPAEPATVYRGADGELLRLQEEVIALAIEALGTAPSKPQTGSEPRRD